MSGRTLILGGGFGGIAAGVELRRLLGAGHEVMMVDRKPVRDGAAQAVGARRQRHDRGGQPAAPAARAARDRVVEAEVTAIDAAGRAVATTEGEFSCDHLVIALGAVSRSDLVPGLEDHGHDVWAVAGVPAAAKALASFEGGRVAVLIAGAPYPCPPAPYEAALHLDEQLRRRGLRERSEISVTTLQPMLMPNAGRGGLGLDRRRARRPRDRAPDGSEGFTCRPRARGVRRRTRAAI